jgi:tetratricopeptide (TPR) repeat protein
MRHGSFPNHAYTFKHALTHEVAYSSLLQEQRRLWHARIVEALAGLAGDRVAEQVERLAHHALQGAVWEKAVPYCQQAGTRAATHSAYREAVAYFEQALTALAQLPEYGDTLAQAIDLRFALRNALLVLGENERLLEHLRAAETLARTLGDQRRLGQVSAYLGAHFHFTGAYDQAITAYQRTIATSTALGEVALQVQVTLMQGITYYTLGNYHRAIDCFSNNVAFLVGKRSRELFGLAGFPAVFSHANLALCLMELGAFAEGRVHAEEAVRVAEVVNQPFSLTEAYHVAGALALRQGDLPKAIPLLERGLHLCQGGGVPRFFPALALALGVAYALCGRVAETLPLLEQAVQLSALRWPSYLSPFLWPAEAYLLVGRLEEATTVACRALDHAIIHKERGYQAQARWLLGEVARRCDPPEAAPAKAHYRQALTLAEALGMRPLAAHCHCGLGMLYAAIGQREQACTALSAALDLYRIMDMTFWLPQTEAARAQVEGQ